jgi:AraC family transcriptional regulator
MIAYELETLQPIMEAIAASLRSAKSLGNQHVSVTLPEIGGQTVVISVRATKSRRGSSVKSAPRGLDQRQLRLIEGAIEENLGEPLTVSMLSSVAGLSRSHFSHAFRASVGRTPHAHIVRLRIERAMRLMTDTDLPMSGIALATGFSDQAHFSNKFRRVTGVSPRQWRKDCR